MKKLILASVLAAISASSFAADYYVVVPLPKRESVENIFVSLNATSLPGGMAGQPYPGFSFASALLVKGDSKFNGTGVKWSLVGGALPAGLTLTPEGWLVGTPTAGETAKFQLQATYKTKSGQQAYQVVVGQINIALASSTMPQGVDGKPYSYDFASRLTVSGDPSFNPGAVTWSVVSGTLPAGLTLTADGKLGGTLAGSGTSTFQVQAAYKNRAGVQSYQVIAGAITVGLAGVTLPDAQQGTAYVYDFKPQLSVSGDPSYSPSAVTWTVVNSLPAGLQLTNNGTLTGTPSAAGSSNIEISARYLNKTASRVYPLTVKALAPDLRHAGTPNTSQNFGSTPVGTAATPIAFAIINSGNAPGTLTLPAFGGATPADFSVSATCTNVAPQGNCQVTVGFKPAQVGTRSATLNIAGTTITFNGTGQQVATSYVVLTSGTSYQIPAGITTVKAWAAGGGGGGSGAYAVDGVTGGGGGAGGAVAATFATTPGQTLTYTIGAGGAGGYGGSPGASGGLTSVNYGTLALKAYGGTGGYFNATAAAPGGTASGGDVNSLGGTGAGASGDQGGGSGGGIGGASGMQGGQAGAIGARGINISGLHEALAAAGQAVGNPGYGADASSSSPNNMSGQAATGYGNGGGSAGWYGGNGGNGSRGGGGGGAAGYTGTQTGGTGGNGFIVLKLN